jgi:hypothetical protein
MAQQARMASQARMAQVARMERLAPQASLLLREHLKLFAGPAIAHDWWPHRGRCSTR